MESYREVNPEHEEPPPMQQPVVGETGKKKRGRPRKSAPPEASPQPNMTTPTDGSSPQKRGRGRPKGSATKSRTKSATSAGLSFTPHVLMVGANEDVATKILSFSQLEKRAVCVLSANGACSSVTLRQPSASGGTVTYEGRFEILSLAGSFLPNFSGGNRSRTGGLSISLAGPDGRVVGGGVAGLLLAATPIQIVAGMFDVRPPEPESEAVDTALLPSASPSQAPAANRLLQPTGGGTAPSPEVDGANTQEHVNFTTLLGRAGSPGHFHSTPVSPTPPTMQPNAAPLNWPTRPISSFGILPSG